MANSYSVIEESTQQNGDWVHSCGTVLLSANVYHSVHNGAGPLSGFGGVDIEQVPYCPKCQEKPSQIGAPVRQSQADIADAVVLRRMRDQQL